VQISITLLYGGALALWFVLLSARVIQGRFGPGKPGLGDGGDSIMIRRIRAHGNFAEYVPLVLILMGFLEINGTAPWIIHALGASLLVGRLLHGYAFAFTSEFVFGRSGGIVLTLIALIAAGILALGAGLRGL
jgi:hypothetical protein